MEVKTKIKKKTNNSFVYIGLFIIGLLIFLYPFVSMLLEKYNQTTVIANYVDEIKNKSPELLKQNQKAIDDFNRDLNNDQLKTEGVSYVNLLNPGEVLGYIEIPKINVNLPIYQGTSEIVLKDGVGHIEKSSFPTDIDTAHVLLTGHRGLSTSVLFTDLNKMEVGDTFYITILDRKYTYIVESVDIVLPTEADKLRVENGENVATLITCTPYMINTHRILVRGAFSMVENTIVEPETDNSTSIAQSNDKSANNATDNLNNNNKSNNKSTNSSTSTGQSQDDLIIEEGGGSVIADGIDSLVHILKKEVEYVDMPMIIMFAIESLFLAGIQYTFLFLKKEESDDEKIEEVKKEDLIDEGINENDFEDKNINEKDFEEEKIDKEDFESKELDK